MTRTYLARPAVAGVKRPRAQQLTAQGRRVEVEDVLLRARAGRLLGAGRGTAGSDGPRSKGVTR